MATSYYQPNVIPYQIRFESALKEPILKKCENLNKLIQESMSSNIKEIQQRFVVLIEDIFSFQTNVYYPRNSTDWNLRTIAKEMNLNEFNSIFEFLKTNGVLMQLIRHLMADPNIRYDFPITCLPAPTQSAFKEGYISNFYSNKIPQNLSNSISLNAFEFFIFHFAYYIINPELSKNNSNGIESNPNNFNVVYYAILENYMENFIPVPSLISTVNSDKNNESQSLWKSLSSTTSNILNLASHKNEFQMDGEMANFNSMNHKSSIVSSKILSLNKFQPNESQNNDLREHDVLGTPLFKCETLLNILVEFWLNHSFSSNYKNNQIGKNLQHTNFNCTIEHMRVIRVFVKHLHYFSNSNRKKNCDLNNTSVHTQFNSGGIVTSEAIDPLDDLRRNLWSSKYHIQKKLYQFLRFSFDRWPNDSSFRVPLETWLSYIQPWRYTTYTKSRNSKEDNNDTENQSLDHLEWKRFISENLFFYTTIFRQVINRIVVILDLNSTSSAFLLYRMTKVFAQDRLCELIKESEQNLHNGHGFGFNLRANTNNLLSPSIKHMTGNWDVSFKNSFAEMEPNSLEYVPLFTSNFRDQIISLFMKIAKNLRVSFSSKRNSSINSSTQYTLFKSILNFFSNNSENSNYSESKVMEHSKTRHYLESSVQNLSSIFDIQQQSVDTIMNSEKNVLNQTDTTDALFNESNAYEIVDGIPKLTQYGRNMILNGTLKHDKPNFFEGNPDEQPTKTFELEFLVKFFFIISSFINEKYQDFFVNHYHKQSFLGTILQQLLSPPTKYVCYKKERTLMESNMGLKSLPPRVNLRFMASKAFVFYFFILLLLSYLFKFSVFKLILLGWVIFLSYHCTKSVLTNLKTR